MTDEDDNIERRRLIMPVEFERGHEVKAVVIITADPDGDPEVDWSASMKRVGHPAMDYETLARHLYTMAAEVELQGIVGGDTDDPSSGYGES